MNPTRERVSVVITTRNESRNIGHCLASIEAQTYPKEFLEIIVVDNQSSDNTKELALKHTDKVFDHGPERSAQRNYGFAKATGDIFLFLDADMILSEGVIKHSVAKMHDEGFCALYIPEIVLGRGFFPRVRRFERSFYDATVIDCVRVFTRRAFEGVGGFDESLTGPEDWDFDKKIRALAPVGLLSTYDFDQVDSFVSNSPDQGLVSRLCAFEKTTGLAPLLFHNEAAFQLGRYLTKKTYYGESFAAYQAKWPANDPDLARQFGPFYRYFGVFLEKGRWRRLVSHLSLAAGMYFLRFLVGVMFVLGKFKP